MIKRMEISVDGSCWNKAKDDEMTFIILGRDKASPATIRFWIQQRILMGLNHVNDVQLSKAEYCAQQIERELLGVK